MTTINSSNAKSLDSQSLDLALNSLAIRLAENQAAPIADLRMLAPSAAELETAARWTITHDVSEGFAMVLKDLLRKLGYENVAERL